MSLYTGTRTLTCTKDEVAVWCRAQDDFYYTILNNNTNAAAVTNMFASYGSATIALVFSSVLSGPAAIGLGVFGLLTTLNSTERQNAYNDASRGYIEILKTRNMMTELKAVKVNFTIKTNIIRWGTNNDMDYAKSCSVNWYQLPDGTKIQ